MAKGDDIQVDKGGFVRIHNTILEKLAKAHLRGQQYRLILFLFRMTYGYNKKENKISLKQWADGTDLQRQNVWRELHLLVEWQVIYMKSNGERRPATWGFNKYFDQWKIPTVITDDYKSVIICDYTNEQSVITGDYSDEKSVITGDYKSVITLSHTRELKDSKDSSSTTTAAAKKSARSVSEFVLAYERIWGLTVSSSYIGDKIQEWESRVTLEAWEYALKESADSKNQGHWKYLRKILERVEREGYLPKTDQPASASSTLDFAIEDTYQ
jgi:phage replication O-like protein O